MNDLRRGIELTSQALNWPMPRAVARPGWGGDPPPPPAAGPGSGLDARRTPAGTALELEHAPALAVKLAGAGPAYTFTEQVETAAGFADGPRRGAAYEVNNVAGLAGSIVLAYPDPFGAYRFQWVAVGTAPPPPGGVTLQGCFCVVPATLVMFSADPACNYRMFQSCTIRYQAAPAGSGYTNIFMSDQQFIDPTTSYSFYYQLSCNFNQFYLSRVFPVWYGSTFYREQIYSWIVGGTNTCSPFALSAGASFNGSDASCCVSIGASQVPCSRA